MNPPQPDTLPPCLLLNTGCNHLSDMVLISASSDDVEMFARFQLSTSPDETDLLNLDQALE
jgi:hypothetical protein